MVLSPIKARLRYYASGILSLLTIGFVRQQDCFFYVSQDPVFEDVPFLKLVLSGVKSLISSFLKWMVVKLSETSPVEHISVSEALNDDSWDRKAAAYLPLPTGPEGTAVHDKGYWGNDETGDDVESPLLKPPPDDLGTRIKHSCGYSHWCWPRKPEND